MRDVARSRPSASRTCSYNPSVVSASPTTTSFLRLAGGPRTSSDRSPAVLQLHRLSLGQRFAHRPVQDTEAKRQSSRRWRRAMTFKAEAKAVGVAVADTKAIDGEVFRVDDASFLLQRIAPAESAPFPSPRDPRASARRRQGYPRLPWILIDPRRSAAAAGSKEDPDCRARGRMAMVNRSRSSLRKPAPLPSSFRWVPSPQSTRIRSPPASTRSPGWLRSADGTLADVPRNVRPNILCMPPQTVASWPRNWP